MEFLSQKTFLVVLKFNVQSVSKNFVGHAMRQPKVKNIIKEKPDHWDDKGTILPPEVTEEVISKNAGEDLSWVNLKFCSLCPSCMQLNEKKDDSNILSCYRCKKKYCHLCNKGIEGA